MCSTLGTHLNKVDTMDEFTHHKAIIVFCSKNNNLA